MANMPFGTGDAISVDPLRPIKAVTAGVAFPATGIVVVVLTVLRGAERWMDTHDDT